MPQGQVVLGLPPSILNLIQEGVLERAFHDALVPAFQYRQEAKFQPWEGNIGTEVFFTRRGTMAPSTTPLTPGVDPQPKQVAYEQWAARIDQYGDTIDTHMPTSAVAAANLFMSNIHTLGVQAGQSLNRIPRNAMFKAYLSGQTATTAAAAAGDTTIAVAALNGFTDVLAGATGAVRPQPVSPAFPLPVTIFIAGVPVVRNVIGFQPNTPTDLFGPGVLLLSAAVGGAGAAARSPVVSSAAPLVLRSGGGNSIDAIGAGDTLVLQDIINAANRLRGNNVGPHEDGYYHAHIDPTANSQLFADPVFQRLNQSLPEGVTYRVGFLGEMAGILFFMNTESPNNTNAGTLTLTGTTAQYAAEIGAEVVNDTAPGIVIGRVLVTGKGVAYELGLDESNYVSEAGVTGKIGDFDIINNGVSISTERIRLILRAPINRMQDIVAATWSLSGAWPIPTDITAVSSAARYKRALIIESASG